MQIYKEGYYQKAERFIDKKMVELYPTIRRAQRAEVLDYIKILTHMKSEDIPKQEYIINLKNTRLDLRSGKTLPFDPSVIDFCRIPVIYDPDAYCADLDKTLNKVFKHDRQVIDLFEEMVGYMLIKNCRFRKGFLFYGSGSNGNLLKKFIGEENCSTIELEKLSDRFKTAELENKLVNIGDDINRRDIIDTGTIKKLFTGESVTVERKGQDPFTLKNYAKMIFSCNEIPRIADKTYGMYSRLMLIPFTAKFSPLDDDFDPFIEDNFNSFKKSEISLTKPLLQVDVTTYSHFVDDVGKELYNGVIPINGSKSIYITYSDPAVNVSANVTNGTLVSANYYTNACLLTITGNGDVSVNITGDILKTSETIITISTGEEKGEIQKVENPLITTSERAVAIGEWVKDYLSNRKILSSEWRADPRLDVMDIITVENNYGSSLVRTTSVSFTYNGAFRGQSEGRILDGMV